MFKITPIQDTAEQRQLAALAGTEYRDGFFAYKMIEESDGSLMGFSQFEIRGEDGCISDLKEPKGREHDFEAMFILGRATMNFIDLCGAHVCYAEKEAADESLLRAIGFREERGELLFSDMTDMFSGNCSH